MKIAEHRLNRASLALNAVLAAGCVFLLVRHPAAAPRPSAAAADLAARRASIESHPTPSAAPGNPVPAQPRPWVEVLRNQGVPEKVIARLALADFEDRWQLRQAKAQEGYNRGDLDADGLAALARQHDVEEENDLRARLGESAYREWDAARLFQQFNLGNIHLTASETNALYDLAASLREHLRELEESRANNQIDQTTFNAEQSKANAEFQKQVRALVGDERYGAMQGTDPAVGDLRRELRGLTVDDGQFAALLQAEQQWNAARGQLEQQRVETGDTNIQEQLDAVSSARDNAFANILGTNGLELFRKQQDSRYVELEKNAASWGLDEPSLEYVYSALQTYDHALAEYQRQTRQLEARGIKIDLQKSREQWSEYDNQMAQYVRGNLTEPRYQAVVRNQMLPFAGP